MSLNGIVCSLDFLDLKPLVDVYFTCDTFNIMLENDKLQVSKKKQFIFSQKVRI